MKMESVKPRVLEATVEPGLFLRAEPLESFAQGVFIPVLCRKPP